MFKYKDFKKTGQLEVLKWLRTLALEQHALADAAAAEAYVAPFPLVVSSIFVLIYSY